jgi:ribosomal protein S18 acetylase RimI-like enzyme
LGQIRLATIDDTSRMAEIQTAGWRSAYKGIISDYELFTERQVIWAIERLKTRMATEEIMNVYEENNIVLGFICHGKARDNDNKSYEIYAFYVQPEFTRQGIGQILLNYILHKAKSELYEKLNVYALEGNYRGINFYKKNGFAEDGVKKHIEKWNKNEIRMVKLI